MATLFTFGPSHYCEKARWALDLAAVRYREVRWAPGPHLLSARRLAPRSLVPILCHSKTIIQGSGRITDWAEASGGMNWRSGASSAEKAEIAELEAWADDALGVAVRRLIYAASLGTESRAVAAALFRGAIWWQRPLAPLMWPISRRAIMRGLRATAEDIPDARAALERELDHLDRLVSGQNRFLVGDHLGRADIAVASLLSPIIFPAEHPVYGTLRPWQAQRRIMEAYRDRPCVHWTAALYRDFRRPPRDDAAAFPG